MLNYADDTGRTEDNGMIMEEISDVAFGWSKNG